MGDPKQQREQAENITFLPIKPVARLAFTRTGLDDMIRILGQTRDNYDKLLGRPAPVASEGDER